MRKFTLKKWENNLLISLSIICCCTIFLSGCGAKKADKTPAAQTVSANDNTKATKPAEEELTIKNMPAPKKGQDNPYAKFKNYAPGSREYAFWYTNEYATSAFNTERQKVDEIINSKQEPIPITIDKSNCVIRSKDTTSQLFYKGEMKGITPNGWGIIYKVEKDISRTTNKLLFAGKFEDGYINGYMQIYSINDQPNDHYDAGRYEGDCYATYLIEEGFFNQKGDKTLGNGFTIRYTPSDRPAGSSADAEVDSMLYDVTMGKVIGTKRVDIGKKFYMNQLYYEGEFNNDDKPDGKGTLYFKNGKIKYKGEFKDDVYNGKGILYKENGDVDYDGNWSDGDYAK